MQGRAFLNVAKRLILRSTEEDWRTASGRAYYAAFSEARAALRLWGFVPAKRDPIHSFVRLRFSNTKDKDIDAIGQALELLGRLRNEADYQLEKPGRFVSSAAATIAVQEADGALLRLDQIQSDIARRAAAIAAVRAAWP